METAAILCVRPEQVCHSFPLPPGTISFVSSTGRNLHTKEQFWESPVPQPKVISSEVGGLPHPLLSGNVLMRGSYRFPGRPGLRNKVRGVLVDDKTWAELLLKRPLRCRVFPWACHPGLTPRKWVTPKHPHNLLPHWPATSLTSCLPVFLKRVHQRIVLQRNASTPSKNPYGLQTLTAPFPVSPPTNLHMGILNPFLTEEENDAQRGWLTPDSTLASRRSQNPNQILSYHTPNLPLFFTTSLRILGFSPRESNCTIFFSMKDIQFPA